MSREAPVAGWRGTGATREARNETQDGGSVFDDRQLMLAGNLEKSVQLAGMPIEMDGHDGFHSALALVRRSTVCLALTELLQGGRYFCGIKV